MSGEDARTAFGSARAFALDRPGSMLAAILLAAVALAAFAAPLVAPQNPFDLASFDVLDADLPPFFLDGSDPRFLLGTDSQGRDLLSAILYGTRISLTVGVLAVAIQAAIGVPLGLIGGYVGGKVDGLIARIADVQLSLSTLILAIIALALVRAGLGGETLGRLAVPLLVLVIGLAEWPYFARTARAATLAESAKDHVRAAK
ncbi:MAG TPA: ABC transporter permease subunit, partial [Methyloceanibacter sp.]|nr:ABC transporter permease subunit [Methyloceanibacter sp.]